MEKETYAVGLVDYVIVAASLVLCVAIGACSGIANKEGGDKVSAYLLGSRQMAMIPVAFSIMATVLSGNSIAGYIGEIYLFGISSFVAILGGMAVKVFAAYYIVPVFHNLPYTSIYEYLERRFDRTLRTFFSGMYMICHVLYLGTVLYGPALSITTVSGIPYWATSCVVGVICTAYCIMGGLKAVIWTDVFQAIMMFVCVILVMITSVTSVGGFGKVFQIGFAPGVTHFHLLESATVRYSVWSLLFNGICLTIKSTIMGQAGAQRMLAVKNGDIAKQSVIFSSCLMVVFKVFVVLAALAIYACFSHCDPLQREASTGIHSADQMYIYAVSKQMSHLPGLQGLALAGLLSASLSTCSSFINSFATLTLEDFIKPFRPQWAKTEAREIILCKVLTTIYGVITIAASLAIPYMGGIIKVNLGITGAALGPLAGVMVSALFWWRSTARSSKVAMLIGMVFTTWLTIGSLLYPVKFDTIPHDTSGCAANLSNGTSVASNVTSACTTIAPTLVYSEPGDILMEEMKNTTTTTSDRLNAYKFLFPLSDVSFVWFGTLGMLVTILLVILISFIGETEFTDPRLLSPLAADFMIGARRKKNSKEFLEGSNVNILYPIVNGNNI